MNHFCINFPITGGFVIVLSDANVLLSTFQSITIGITITIHSSHYYCCASLLIVIHTILQYINGNILSSSKYISHFFLSICNTKTTATKKISLASKTRTTKLGLNKYRLGSALNMTFCPQYDNFFVL